MHPASVETNINLETRTGSPTVVFEPPAAWTQEGFLGALREAGILLVPFGGRRVRAVTHGDVSAEDCRRAVAAIASVLATMS